MTTLKILKIMGTSIFSLSGAILISFCVCVVVLLVDFFFNKKRIFKLVIGGLILLALDALFLTLLVIVNAFAIFIYPVSAWTKPQNAAITKELGLVKPIYNGSKASRFFNNHILIFLDGMVVKFWNWVFLHFAPMQKRKFFIDELGYGVAKLSENTQKRYFIISSRERKVYLVKNNMLSERLIQDLFFDNNKVFVEAGKISDEQFARLNYELREKYCSKYDLSLAKQKSLIEDAIREPRYCGSILRNYIIRKGLHPEAVQLLCEKISKFEEPNEYFKKMLTALKCRQDLVIVWNTGRSESQEFEAYLKERKTLTYNAQMAMSTWQYEIFHAMGLNLQPKAVCDRLARINKSDEDKKFIEMMMRFGEIDNNEVALAQIAGEVNLSCKWAEHLAEIEKKPTA